MRTEENETELLPAVTVREGKHASRPRAPRALLKNRGTLKNISHRDQDTIEVIVEDPIGGPPDYFDDEEKKVWAEFVSLCPAGVLTSVDRVLLEQAACLLRKCRQKHWDVTAQTHQRMTMLLGLMGMTPADRSRVSVRKKRVEANPYADD